MQQERRKLKGERISGRYEDARNRLYTRICRLEGRGHASNSELHRADGTPLQQGDCISICGDIHLKVEQVEEDFGRRKYKLRHVDGEIVRVNLRGTNNSTEWIDSRALIAPGGRGKAYGTGDRIMTKVYSLTHLSVI